MLTLSPSILSGDFSRLGEEIALVEQAGATMLHIDVMDGQFVPSISYGTPVIESIRKVSSMLFDVHVMTERPERFIEEFIQAGADIITVHVEACPHLDGTIQKIKSLGSQAGVVLNPSTSLHTLEYVLDKYGFKVSQLYIAQVKRKHGIIERDNYNHGEGKAKVPQVPVDKEKAIEDALRHFQMI